MKISHYLDFVDLKYSPSKDDLICKFFIKSKDIKKASGAVAAESSIGTWTETSTTKPYVNKLKAKVCKIESLTDSSANIEVAYPNQLWELGNMPGILSGIAGNIFGMKEISLLKLKDVVFPENIIKSFKGPKYGIPGIRKILKIENRPLIGTIIKPKMGLNSSDHAKVAYQAWLGGCDGVKDDENLVDVSFNKFSSRLAQTLKFKRKAEKETGSKKIYMINVTAETKEMLKRAKLVQDSGNEYIMVDIITTGWSALQTLRNENFDLVIHAHRAGYGMFARLNHGISMKVISKLTRIIGCDQLHIGTGVGKMFETKRDVLQNLEALKEPLYGIKQVMPVSSGGLHPAHIPFLYDLFGKDLIIQMGGGIHSHPKGTFYGAMAARQALDAALNHIPLKQYAKNHEELAIILKKFSK